MKRARFINKIYGLIFSVVLAAGLMACGSSNAEYNYDYPVGATMEMEEAAYSDYASDATNGAGFSKVAEDSSVVDENTSTANRKLIKTVNMTVETKEFDSLVSILESSITGIGGYIESMDGSYGSQYYSYRTEKYATIVARVPVARLDEFLSIVGSNGNVTYRSEYVTDVTLSYVDLESHKKMLLEEQNRLMELLAQAEEIEDIITIEGRLTDVRYQLESMESQLRTFDNQIEYSTVTINVDEVVDYSASVDDDKTPGERMKEGFISSLNGVFDDIREFAINFVINIPYIIIYVIIIAIIVVIIRVIFKRCKLSKNKKKEAETNNAPQNNEQISETEK